MSAETVLIHRNIPDSFGTNAYLSDPDFARLLRVYGAPDLVAAVEPHFIRLGQLVRADLDQLALAADSHPPVLKSRTRSGADWQSIDKHPSYVALERHAFSGFGLAAMSHRGGVFGWPAPLPPVIKYGLTMLFVQAEFGLCCPVSMTDALTRTLTKFGSAELVARFRDRLITQDFAELFQGAMFMTEQDAGSDVGAITTAARPAGDGTWRLTGDKWFCSNADADLAMVLARPEGGAAGTRGLSLFLLPRVLADGQRNSYRIVRLKDKLGTRSMASGEIVLDGATAYLVGEPGAGFKQMTDMINMSRLSNAVRSAGLMLRAAQEALFIARHRRAFGGKLVALPLMRRQLVKLMVSAEQGRSLALHTADCLRRADAGDAEAAKLLRILTPLMKFRTCRDARKVTGDGMEVRGGSGYIEEWSDARVLRDAHLGSIWEGTSNIVALDVARSIRREQTLGVLKAYLGRLLEAPGIPAVSKRALGRALDRAAAFAAEVAADPAREAETRRMASGLYHAASAIVLAYEAARIGSDMRRLALAHLVLRHRLSARDPLAPDDDDADVCDALLSQAPIDATLALSLAPGAAS
ncbi:acyl-CoA dehydrogenase family protein [Phreatobacter stygius]|uniref:DNA alkylation response protein n=1 Tax=Phreatobacter stygius TaxID=1940610 RepID=A0A4D7AWK0_9HYPH|nr:acyl-CoA dehydrogenase family protein [Phreatobacter stygius]QCI64381.1 DNA alkylation response protein [Phreatobacter stygius]